MELILIRMYALLPICNVLRLKSLILILLILYDSDIEMYVLLEVLKIFFANFCQLFM